MRKFDRLPIWDCEAGYGPEIKHAPHWFGDRNRPRTISRFVFVEIDSVRFHHTSSFIWNHILLVSFFIRYWKIESRFPSVLVPTCHLRLPIIVSSCIYRHLRSRNHECANLVSYVSQQRGRSRFSHLVVY